MAAVLVCSPAATHGSAFRSPLRNVGSVAGIERTTGSEEVFGDAQAHLTQWRKDFVSSASFEAQQGLRDLCHEREQLKDLHADLAGMQGLVEAASQLQVGDARLAEVLQSSTKAAVSRGQVVAHASDELRQLNEVHSKELQQEERRVVRAGLAAEAQHAEALKLLGTYSERLGLAITRVAPQTVRMALSLIDECDLQREFFFTLGIADAQGGKASEAYSVCECSPDVPELPQLLAELNAEAASVTALPRFVCSMRRSFAKLASAAKVS